MSHFFIIAIFALYIRKQAVPDIKSSTAIALRTYLYALYIAIRNMGGVKLNIKLRIMSNMRISLQIRCKGTKNF